MFCLVDLVSIRDSVPVLDSSLFLRKKHTFSHEPSCWEEVVKLVHNCSYSNTFTTLCWLFIMPNSDRSWSRDRSAAPGRHPSPAYGPSLIHPGGNSTGCNHMPYEDLKQRLFKARYEHTEENPIFDLGRHPDSACRVVQRVRFETAPKLDARSCDRQH